MSEFDGPTDTERLQIAQHFMLNSPPGQFKLVADDVKKLIPAGILTDALETGIARVYNNKNNKVVKAPSGACIVLSPLGEIDATHYVDTTNGSTFSVNHITLETTEEQVDSAMDPSIEAHRAALQRAVSQYIASNYDGHSSAGCVYAKNGKLFVVITGEKANLRNFWGGKWSSTWEVSATAGGGTSCTGEMKIHAHYFEDGNVQLQTTKPVAAMSWDWAFSDVSSRAAAIVDHIKSRENDLHLSLQSLYMNMDQETFKSIRRILPVTKLKMDWNLNAVKIHGSLSAGLSRDK
jgi:capping protein alpha